MTIIYRREKVFPAVMAMTVLVASFAGPPQWAWAQTPLSLSDAIAAALNNSPRVVGLDRELADRLAEAIETETRLNPELEIPSHRPCLIRRTRANRNQNLR